MYRDTLAGKSPAQRQAAAEAHVTAMHGKADPQHAAMHLRMMEQRCGAPGTAPQARQGRCAKQKSPQS